MAWKIALIAAIAYAAPIVARQDVVILDPTGDRYFGASDWVERFASPNALLNVTTSEKAEAIVSAARQVLYHYDFANFGVRRPPPENLRNRFPVSAPGYCDEGARVFASILGEDFGVKNFNMVTGVPREGQQGFLRERTFSAHTAAAFRLEKGAVLVDPLYGVMLVTERDDFSTEVLQEKDYEAYSLFSAEDPAEQRADFFIYGRFYERMRHRRAYAAYSGERLVVHPSQLTVSPFGSTGVGASDDSSADILNLLGSWADHVGYWYEPVTHVWRVRSRWPGIFELRMDLIDGDGPVMGIPLELEIEIEGGILLKESVASRELLVRFASFGRAAIRTTSVGVSGRKIDRVSVRQLPF